MLSDGLVTTQTGTLPIGEDVQEVSICVHSDTPVNLNLFNLSFSHFLRSSAPALGGR